MIEWSALKRVIWLTLRIRCDDDGYEQMSIERSRSKHEYWVHCAVCVHYSISFGRQFSAIASTHIWKFKLISSGWFNWFNRKKMKQIPNYWIYIKTFLISPRSAMHLNRWEKFRTSREAQLRANRIKNEFYGTEESTVRTKNATTASAAATAFFVWAFMQS